MYLDLFAIEDCKFALEDSRRKRVGGRLLGLHPDLDFVIEFADDHLIYVREFYGHSVRYDYRNAIHREAASEFVNYDKVATVIN